MNKELKELKDFAAKVWDMPSIHDPGDMIQQLLKKIDAVPTPSTLSDQQEEEGRYWYTDTGFPGYKIRMDGIREFLTDSGYHDEKELNSLLKGAGYWACRLRQRWEQSHARGNETVLKNLNEIKDLAGVITGIASEALATYQQGDGCANVRNAVESLEGFMKSSKPEDHHKLLMAFYHDIKKHVYGTTSTRQDKADH